MTKSRSGIGSLVARVDLGTSLSATNISRKWATLVVSSGRVLEAIV